MREQCSTHGNIKGYVRCNHGQRGTYVTEIVRGKTVHLNYSKPSERLAETYSMPLGSTRIDTRDAIWHMLVQRQAHGIDPVGKVA